MTPRSPSPPDPATPVQLPLFEAAAPNAAARLAQRIRHWLGGDAAPHEDVPASLPGSTWPDSFFDGRS